MKRTIPEKMIEGFLVLIGIAEVAHLAALFFDLSFSLCTCILFGIAGVVFAFFLTVSFVKKRKKIVTEVKKEVGFLKLFKVYPVLFCSIAVLMILQIVWNYWMHVPYLLSDITGETVQSFLASGGVYTVNPLTGEAFTAGMPARLKVLCLPTLYGAICKLTGIAVPVLVYSIVPSFVLILTYLVYNRWALYLFPQEGKKQAFFMLFVVLLFQFGCYTASMDGYALFFAGYTGASVRVGIILPYALLCCLREKWKSVVLCILAEVCVVWTLYGLGYTVVVAMVVLFLKKVHSWLERRKKE